MVSGNLHCGGGSGAGRRGPQQDFQRKALDTKMRERGEGMGKKAGYT